MGSLTTRFAALLIASVIGVVVLAAVITSSLARGPGEDQFGRAMAEKALLALDLFKVSPEAARTAGVEIGGRPDDASVKPDVSERIGKTVREIRKGTEVVVLEDRASGRSRLAVKLPDNQWAYLAFPHRPSFPWKSLTLYLTVIAVGVGAIAIYSARRMMQPFRMLESTISSIGPDGTIPVIPEKGHPKFA
ncbi:hypothetical protein [Sinorhizobium sp. BG8]|uniref:hypothetical protein n=1 Tax=Sinorhizobium sp. BG8 TaxID=2613773 RepID=UPI00193E57A4|nr:hypothetical protein [Sinorhizobium sp. BG8]